MVFVLSDTNKKLMPTSSYRARKLLKSGKAIIYKYRPFTIKLTQRIYRGRKVSKGRVSVRRQHYQYRPGDRIWVNGIRYIVKGTQDRGTRVAVHEHLPLSAKKIEKCVHIGGWVLVS